MRPVDKGDSPQVFTKYEDAKQPLCNRLGTYCSYCERRIPTNIAVEHILPKNSGMGFEHLQNEWTNFLLSCVNCNSTKGIKVPNLSEYLLPDRDNTFQYYEYLETGIVEACGDNPIIKKMAQNTLDLVGLNNHEFPDGDEAIVFSAIERSSQRVQAWVQAKEAREDYENGEVCVRRIAKEAAGCGFFSIWMKAFEGIPAVRQELINVFGNTAAECFDENTNPISPRPANSLLNSGKS